MSTCVAFSYTFYAEITSNQMFLLILEQYVVMYICFILPIVIDCVHLGGRRIRVAQTLSLPHPPRHWFTFHAGRCEIITISWIGETAYSSLCRGFLIVQCEIFFIPVDEVFKLISHLCVHFQSARWPSGACAVFPVHAHAKNHNRTSVAFCTGYDKILISIGPHHLL